MMPAAGEGVRTMAIVTAFFAIKSRTVIGILPLLVRQREMPWPMRVDANQTRQRPGKTVRYSSDCASLDSPAD
jgi:hypothetical protein